MDDTAWNAGEGEDRRIMGETMPLLPVRDGAIFPYIITPLTVSRARAIQAIEAALANDSRMVFIVSQRERGTEEPAPRDLYTTGTVAVIMRMLKFPDARVKVLLQGLCRATLLGVEQEHPHMSARVQVIQEPEADVARLEVEALVRNVRRSLERVVQLGKGVNPEVLGIANSLDSAGQLADLVASNLDLKNEEVQEVLETPDPIARLHRVAELANREVQILNMQRELTDQVRDDLDRTQREYFLRQQLRAIQQELGEGNDQTEELLDLQRKAEEAGLPEEAQAEFDRNLRRLERIHPDSAESALVRNYLETVVSLPWTIQTPDNLDLEEARRVLDEDHYGLDEVKERILEFLAVRKLKSDLKGPILCFVGPPGVGKTSLGRSIARALGRSFVRLSLGGVRDEAEIRGHRRTYVGAMPGRILQGMQQAKTVNPVFMLDEVDKIGADFRGDPSSALLEVLDPEQNFSFRDHYLGFPYDLSHTLFIATANLMDPIQPAFRDRMEVIRLAGYTQNEKVEIARRHLIPKQLEAHGLDEERVHFSGEALKAMIERYTDEAGLRNLERLLARVARKVARSVAEGKEGRSRVTIAALEKYLGVPRKLGVRALHSPRVGVSTGLAVTATGGDVLFVEALIMPGTGQLILTGHLGDVMKESARAALSYARARAVELGIEEGAFDGRDIHLHVPEGAIPKDGPSAGVTMASALVSALTRRPVRSDLAMTGEITLRGALLPVGGIREKLLAARRAGVDRVLIPEENRKDLKDVPHTAMGNMKVVCARSLDEVMAQALLDPEPVHDDHPSDIPARPEGVALPTGVGISPSNDQR